MNNVHSITPAPKRKSVRRTKETSLLYPSRRLSDVHLYTRRHAAGDSVACSLRAGS